jgi:hypothetical protein
MVPFGRNTKPMVAPKTPSWNLPRQWNCAVLARDRTCASAEKRLKGRGSLADCAEDDGALEDDGAVRDDAAVGDDAALEATAVARGAPVVATRAVAADALGA